MNNDAVEEGEHWKLVLERHVSMLVNYYQIFSLRAVEIELDFHGPVIDRRI